MSLDQPQFSRYVRDFSPGYMDSPEGDTLPPGATNDARNWLLASIQEQSDGAGKRAILRKRKGAELLNPASMSAASPVDLVFWYQPERSLPELIAACGGWLYRFDGVSAFTPIAALTGMTPGVRLFAYPFKDNVMMSDGTVMMRYNGTTVVPVGVNRPTSAPGLAAVAPNVLPNGSVYESYAVWYDSSMLHESSQSDLAPQITLTGSNGTRRHTKPSGTPPANIDFWRVYVRRVDTSELNFFLTATIPIATTTFDESVSDTARRIAGDPPFVNEPPPPFKALAVFKGYGVGIQDNQSYYSISKIDDLESWNPVDVFALERGSGKPLRSVNVFGGEILLQKPTKTWRLTGDRPPFKAEPVHTEFGNVGPESAIEIERVYYAWDEQKGPYRTDLVDWYPLAKNHLDVFFLNLNRDELKNIKVEHDPERFMVVWAIPCTSRAKDRRQHLIAYNYRLNAWLPPISGLEYATLARWQPPEKKLGLYIGDYWGRVYKAFERDREGVPDGQTVAAPVTSATTGSVTCTGANFYTTGSGLAGLPVLLESPTGGFQWRRIQSNTDDTITLDTVNDAPFETLPGPGWTVHLGAVFCYWTSAWADHDRPDLLKKGGFLFVEGKSSTVEDVLRVEGHFNQSPAIVTLYDFAFPTSGAIWGQDVWGEAYWGLIQRVVVKRRINRAFYSMRVRLQSYFADEPVDVTAYGIEGDGRVRKRGAA